MVLCLFTASVANASEAHPLMSSKYWVNLGAFFAARDFDASASGALGDIRREIDFEKSMGLDDRPDLFNVELGWRFSQRWDLSLQHFFAERHSQVTLDETIEWEDVSYDIGANISVNSEFKVTRVFFSRRFWERERHSLRLGAGFHFIEASLGISGEATLDDTSTEFRTSAVSASVPVPNIGGWYRYSPSDRWLLNVRADWFSANMDDYSGGIWNVAAGANYRLTKNFGIGISYQLFEMDGTIKETAWRGKLRTRFTGPHIYLTGFW
jgi:hypothetical protein